MKIYVYQNMWDSNRVDLSITKNIKILGYMGELDLDIKPEKKWATKEAIILNMELPKNTGDDDTYIVRLPQNHKNAKCTYEIEE
jgi:hypothetical protein